LSLLQGAWAKARFVADLYPFLRGSVTPAAARAEIGAQMARRERSFLTLVEQGVYANPTSAFRKLLLNAGIGFADLSVMVEQTGLEATAARLYQAGVFLSYEEFRGSQPVRRGGGLEFVATPGQFDNPLLASRIERRSSGSRGPGSRSFTDLTLLAHEAGYFTLLLEAHGLSDRPVGLWRPQPPSFAGLNTVLRFAKLGRPPAAWFSQAGLSRGPEGARAVGLLIYALLLARLAGKPLPWPRYVPQDAAVTVARWLAEMRSRGTPALLRLVASAATRVCLAAQEADLDISGSVFWTTGEPYTPAKAAAVESVGARAISTYAASELGTAGLFCANPSSLDDLHLTTDKFLVSSRPKALDGNGTAVSALVYTTIMTNCRKIMLNVESGDTGELSQRECGCPLQAAGFPIHLTGLHGYDKLTSEGVTFVGSEVFTLLEQELPRRFGGGPIDYQLAEEEDADGVPRVSVVVAPRVGPVDEPALIAAVFEFLEGRDHYGRGVNMAAQWRQAGTLRVVRREPYATGSMKVMPLHLLAAAPAERPGDAEGG
jgi:hypothetical protein